MVCTSNKMWCSCKPVVGWSACNIANFRKFYTVRKRSACWQFEILKCGETRNKGQWLHAYKLWLLSVLILS